MVAKRSKKDEPGGLPFNRLSPNPSPRKSNIFTSLFDLVLQGCQKPLIFCRDFVVIVKWHGHTHTHTLCSPSTNFFSSKRLSASFLSLSLFLLPRSTILSSKLASNFLIHDLGCREHLIHLNSIWWNDHQRRPQDDASAWERLERHTRMTEIVSAWFLFLFNLFASFPVAL